jgi:hypothetical protein
MTVMLRFLTGKRLNRLPELFVLIAQHLLRIGRPPLARIFLRWIIPKLDG